MARRIFGSISVENVKSSGTQLRVIAWDADIDEDDHMGSAAVAEDGSYIIEYKDEKWDWSPVHSSTGWRPDIYVVVEWLDPFVGLWKPIAKSKVFSDQDMRYDRKINLSVTIPNTNSRTIYGRVIDGNSLPLEGYTVTAWDEDVAVDRGESEKRGVASMAAGAVTAEFMGSAMTDQNGEYRILYAGNWWDEGGHYGVRAGRGTWWRPDVFVKVHKKERSGVLCRSTTHQDVHQGTGVKIDVTVE